MGVERFLRLFDFFSVLLRAATLIFQTLVIGGVTFLGAVLPLADGQGSDLAKGFRRWIRAFALALAATQVFYIATDVFILSASGGIPVGEALGAEFVRAAGLVIAAAIVVAILCSRKGSPGKLALFPPAVLILAGSVMTSHSAARMDNRILLAALTGLHQAATAAWIGGLPFLVLVLLRARGTDLARGVSRRFSTLALGSVAVLAFSGMGLSANYVGSWSSLYETAYGVMVAAKASLFLCLLGLGALNFFAVRAAGTGQEGSLGRVRYFGEVEIGIGLTVVLAAASLTSQPPAVDLAAADRLSVREIAARMTPQWPRFSTPSVSQLSTTVQAAEPSAYSSASDRAPDISAQQMDIAWSEYNHHWAGLIVFLMGLFALLARARLFPLARNWPLMFIALAVFLFFRADPEAWPLGPRGFWESWLNPEDLQHRFFVLLIVAFAIFEWKVQTGRIASRWPALVFPAVCALAGAALLTHSHSFGNVKEELLVELSHTPIAIAGAIAGWSRWLEIRLPEGDRAKPWLSWIWPVCFIVVGAVLLDYREA
jgi:putative copper resistance protein D